MFRTAIIATAVISAISAAGPGAAVAQSAPVGKLAAPATAGQWAVVRAGDRTVSHCVMGLRSDAPAPQAGQPQFMFSADGEFVLLRVRAAEWSFDRGRDIPVLMVTADGSERRPAAAVHGADLIDISFGVAPELMIELAASGHLDIEADGNKIRLPLKGLADVLPDYRNCLASIGQPRTGLHALAVLDGR